MSPKEVCKQRSGHANVARIALPPVRPRLPALIPESFVTSCLQSLLLVAQVQRHATWFRTVYPHMCTAGGTRGTYLFTSHAGTPLCCWDKRNLSFPVHQCRLEHLDHLGLVQQPSTSSSPHPRMPLPQPRRAAKHSGLWLETDPGGDLLIGRAENGALVPPPTGSQCFGVFQLLAHPNVRGCLCAW